MSFDISDVLSSAEDPSQRIWRSVSTFRLHSSRVTHACFSGDDKLVASCGGGEGVRAGGGEGVRAGGGEGDSTTIR